MKEESIPAYTPIKSENFIHSGEAAMTKDTNCISCHTGKKQRITLN